VQLPSDEVTVVVLPLLLVDMLLEAAPAPLVALDPLPELTETPPPPPPTVVWPETCPLPALIEVDIPVGGFSPGFKCTTLHPLEFVLALVPAAAAKPAQLTIAKPVRAAIANFICYSS
jgi:hypothetical protein